MDLFFVFLLYFIAAIFLATIEKDIYIFKYLSNQIHPEHY